MKKLIVYLLAIVSVLGFGLYKVFAQETTTEVTTTEETTTEETTTEDTSTQETTINDSTYTYTDYNDLVDQIFQDVYDDIYQDVYDDVYQDVMDQITEETYNQLYAEIELQLYDAFESPEIINDAIQNRIYDVVDIANNSVVGIESYTEDRVDLGAGVMYKHDETLGKYYVITNNHVVENGDNFKIRFEDETSAEATLLHVDIDADIALLSFADEGLTDLVVSDLGNSSALKKGDIILASGHPNGFNFYGSITFGIVAGIDRFVEGEPITFIQHDAAINSGNSGGPIYNLAGQVVGINVFKYATEEIEGMGFSIPINTVKDIIAEYELNN